MAIESLAQIAAAETGLEIMRIRPTVASPVRPSGPVSDIRGWRIRYAHDELHDDDPPPAAMPNAHTIHVRGTLDEARALETWFRGRGHLAFAGHTGTCGVQL
jgi:hypothetical protein